MDIDLRAGIVRILKPDGMTAGTGFLVRDQDLKILIVTCAHVVQYAGAGPDGTVRVVFLATGDTGEAEVKPEYWRGPDAEDVAILHLENLPEEATPLPLGSSGGTTTHPFKAFGFPEAKGTEGMFGYGLLGDETTAAGLPVLQLTGTTEVTVGFSGGPVLDTVTRRIVGMVTSITSPDEYGHLTETAFIIPSETLYKICPLLRLSDICPYQGLAAFAEAEAEFFLGRDRVIADLVGVLRGSPRFLVIVGPSGSGKSSLVRAGLYPALRQGKVAGSQSWLLLPPVQLKRDPFEALAISGLSVSPGDDLRNPARALLNAHNQATRVVLFLDQFEQIFIPACSEALKEQFIDRLAELLESDLPTTIILALRADYYGHILYHRRLARWLTLGQVNVPPMTLDELRSVIQEPANKKGIGFESGLVETIANEAGKARHSLPLLQSALTQLWGKRIDGVITHQAYNEIGRVAGAIGIWAEDNFSALSIGEQHLAKMILTRLVHFGKGEEPSTRQWVELQDLASHPGEEVCVHQLVQKLADARLLVTDEEPHSKEPTVAIIHDALLEEWERLRQWMREQREFYLWRQRLDGRLQEWKLKRRDSGALLHGALLGEAEGWLRTQAPSLNIEEQRYIRTSRQLQDRIDAEREMQRNQELKAAYRLAEMQRQRADDQEKTRNRFLRMSGVLLVLFLMAMGATIIAGRQTIKSRHSAATAVVAQQTAIAARDRAELQAQVSLSLQLAAQSTNQLNAINYPVARLLAVEAGRTMDTAEVFTVLRQTYYHPGLLGMIPESLGVAILNAEGNRILTASKEGAVEVWDVESGEELALHSDELIWQAVWSGDGSYILTLGESGSVQVWNADTRERLSELKSGTGAIMSLLPSNSGNRALTVSDSGTVEVWDASTSEKLLDLPVRAAQDDLVTWSFDDSDILTVAADGTASVWDSRDGERHSKIQLPKESMRHTALSMDGSLVLTSSDDEIVRVWDTLTGKQVHTFPTYEATARIVDWSADCSRVLSVNDDTSVHIWDVVSGEEVFILDGVGVLGFLTMDADLSDHGDRVLTIADDNTTRIWNTETHEEMSTLPGRVGSLQYAGWSADGNRIMTVSTDDTLQVWQVDLDWELPALSGHQFSVNQAVWNKDGSHILTTSDDSTARVWDATTGAQMLILSGHTGPVNSAKWNREETRILTASEDGTAIIWDAVLGTPVLILSGHTGAVSQAIWNTDESLILTAGDDGTARIWNAVSGAQILVLQGHSAPVNQARWSYDASRILTVSDDGTARIWDVTLKKQVLVLGDHSSEIIKATWNADGSRVLTVSKDGSAHIWDALTGEKQLVLTGHSREINQATWNRRGDRILTASNDGTAAVWDAYTGTRILVLSGHDAEVNDAIWNANETRVLTSGQDGTARIWDAASGEVLVSIPRHEFSIIHATWNASESRILTVGWSLTVHQWYAEIDGLLEASCQRVSRNLTRDEWQRFMKNQIYDRTCPSLPTPGE